MYLSKRTRYRSQGILKLSNGTKSAEMLLSASSPLAMFPQIEVDLISFIAKWRPS
jgi:hypothetical protein